MLYSTITEGFTISRGLNMKNLIVTLLMAVSSALLTGCGSEGGGVVSGNKYTGVFSDSSVTSFTQTGGVALRKPSVPEKAINLIIPSAYAATGNISCFIGESVSFSADALGNTVNIDTTCSTSIDLSIRQQLLESMESSNLTRIGATAVKLSLCKCVQHLLRG